MSNFTRDYGDETKTVFIKKTKTGFELIRNGKPFYIQGAGGNSYFKELAETGANTIRVYDTLNLDRVLNDAHRNNLAVIVDIPLPKYDKKYNMYSDEAENEILKKQVKSLVAKHKNHPALLFWNLGNELGHPLVFWKNSFISTFNDLVDIIHEEDPNHPVSTSIGGVSRRSTSIIYLFSPKLDLLSFNSFGNTKNINLKQISFIFGNRPYYYSELGSDGPWEAELTSWSAHIEQTSTKKAEQIRSRFGIIEQNHEGSCVGSLVFYWGERMERTMTWFSLFVNNYKSEIIKELEYLWKNSDSVPELMGLNYMLVAGKGAKDNIVLKPNELILAEVKYNGLISDSILIKWEIQHDTWQSDYRNDLANNVVKTVDSFVNYKNNTATFVTPSLEGPYRIYVYLIDSNGYFASTNTPFYILNNK